MSSEYIGDLCITEYLDLIRNQENESVLLIAIVANRVQETFHCSTDNKEKIDWTFLENCGFFDFIKKWNGKGASIYNYHNHPDEKLARPSIKDIINPPSKLTIPLNIEIPVWFEAGQCTADEEFRDYVGEGFAFEDLGIVTQEDFFSMQQNPKQTIQILNENIEMYKSANKDNLSYL